MCVKVNQQSRVFAPMHNHNGQSQRYYTACSTDTVRSLVRGMCLPHTSYMCEAAFGAQQPPDTARRTRGGMYMRGQSEREQNGIEREICAANFIASDLCRHQNLKCGENAPAI